MWGEDKMRAINFFTKKDIEEIVDNKTDKNLNFLSLELKDIDKRIKELDKMISIIGSKCSKIEEEIINLKNKK